MQKRISLIIRASLGYVATKRYGMHIVLGMLASISYFSPKAQTHLPGNNMNFIQWTPFPNYHQISERNHLNQKWFFSKYAGVSTDVVFFNGGSTTVLSAPIGLQLNRQLNNHLFAFAGISAAPAFFSFSRSFTDPVFNKSYPGNNLSNPWGLGMNARVEMGLMYINDARTFSISGSIGIERSSYPVYTSDKVNTKKQ